MILLLSLLCGRLIGTKIMSPPHKKYPVLLFLSLALLCRSAQSASPRGTNVIGSSLRNKGQVHRRLEEPSFEPDVDLTRYSLQFVSCRKTVFGVEEIEILGEIESSEEMEEEIMGDGQKKRSLEQYEAEPNQFVTFRFCENTLNDAANPCANAKSCASEYGEMTVDLETYLEITLSHKQEEQERYCELCNECYEMEFAALEASNVADMMFLKRCNGIDTSNCYAECQNIENMEMNGYIDASDFINCQELYDEDDQVRHYAGATCASNGSRIKIGIFSDFGCTIQDETKDIEMYLKDEDGYSMKLSYHLLKQSFDECGVANCLFEDEEDEEVARPTPQTLFEDEEEEEVDSIWQEARPTPQTKEVCQDLFEMSSIQNENGYIYVGEDDNMLDDDWTDDATNTCVEEVDGVLYAGKSCEFPATSVCGVNITMSRPQFCTNNGTCDMIPYDYDDSLDDSLQHDDNFGGENAMYDYYFCVCPNGFYGKYCELVDAFYADDDADWLPPPPFSSDLFDNNDQEDEENDDYWFGGEHDVHDPVPQPSSPSILDEPKLEYELWMSPMDAGSMKFLRDFKEDAQALVGYAHFTPRLFIMDGVESGCTDDNPNDLCSTMCTNGGRYCAAESDLTLDSEGGISGADVVRESLRWLCIWREYTFKDASVWWEYVSSFDNTCGDILALNEVCANEAMTRANVIPESISQCMESSGGLDGDMPNRLLEEQLYLRKEQDVTVMPALRVNKIPIDGVLTSTTALEAVCAGFPVGRSPPYCQQYAVRPGSPSIPQSGSADSTTIPMGPPSDNSLLAPLSNVTTSSGPASSIQAQLASSEPSSLPSSEPSSAPSTQAMNPTAEPTGFVDALAPNSNSGQYIVPHWQILQLLIIFAFSV